MEPVTHIDKQLQVSDKDSSSLSAQKQMQVAGKHYQVRLVHLDPKPINLSMPSPTNCNVQPRLFLRSSPYNSTNARSARIEAELNARTIATEQINKTAQSKVLKFPQNIEAEQSAKVQNSDKIRRNVMGKISELPMAQRDLTQRILNSITRLQRGQILGNKGVKRA